MPFEILSSPVDRSAARSSFLNCQRPALIAAGLYLVLTLGILSAGLIVADGHFVFPLDDTYIAMAISKNLALHGVWGVTRYGFSSSDSSLLFPLLVAGFYRLTGPSAWGPLLLSWLFGLASIGVGARMLPASLSRRLQTWTLVLFVLLPPLFVLGIIGLEHSLHLLLTLLFLECFFEPALSRPDRAQAWKAGLLCLLLVATRYESLFFLPPAFLALLLLRRWRSAIGVALGGAVPVAAYAAVSLSLGGAWLPNSVLLKGVRTHPPSLYDAVRDVALRASYNCVTGAHLVLLTVGLAIVAWILWRSSSTSAIALAILVITALEHIGTARTGWVFRYEDYLIGAAVICAARALPEFLRSERNLSFAAAYTFLEVAGGALAVRCIAAAVLLPFFSGNEYLQQWQMARFLEQHYNRGSVAANDIGAITYFTDVHCLDLVGLASKDIFSASRSGHYTTAFLESAAEAQHVQIAVLYDSWFADPPPPFGGPKLPAAWIRVERWAIPHTLQSGDRVVSFYAVDSSQAATLRSALARFDATLPARVTVLPN